MRIDYKGQRKFSNLNFRFQMKALETQRDFNESSRAETFRQQDEDRYGAREFMEIKRIVTEPRGF
jgi:hypothetical protein